MEDEMILNYPYYETTYLDDDNVKHLVNIREEDYNFYNDRFTILNSNKIYN